MKDNKTEYSVEQLSEKFIEDKFPKSIGFTDAERLLLKSGYQCGFNDANKPVKSPFNIGSQTAGRDIVNKPETNAVTISDEEIETKAEDYSKWRHEEKDISDISFRDGAKWMQEQLNKL